MRGVRRFAEGTTVSVEKSRTEIETLVTRRGATGFLFGYVQGEERRVVARIQFALHDRLIRFELNLPPLDDFKRNARPKMEAEHRRLWRALALGIKAKLELASSGIETFEEVFLANIVTADGGVVKDYVLPAVAEMYATGKVPSRLMLGPGGGEKS